MSKMLSALLTACLLVFPFATYAADYGSQQPQSQQSPPVAQPLVREGDFAIKLAQQLNLGTTNDEATAEDMLARAGVMPANGWISDYPVTPEIIGQLNDAIMKASASGRLEMGSDKAQEQLTTTAQSMSLPLPAGTSEAEYTSSTQPDQTIVNNYYYDQGPPVITYYPPPPDYVYLYDWVPYPVAWFGIWFPGFYICHDFTTVVPVDHFHHDNVHDHHRAIVTNHVIDPHTGRTAFVDPAIRSGGSVRAETMLRSDSGRTFQTMPELRSSPGSHSPSPGPPPSMTRFGSPEGRRGSEAIQSRSIEHFRGNMARNFSQPRSVGPSFNSGSMNNPTPSQPLPQRSIGPSGRPSAVPRTPSSPPPAGGMRPGGGSSQGRAAGGGGGMRGGGRR